MKIFILGVFLVVLLGVAGFLLSLSKNQEEPKKQVQQSEQSQTNKPAPVQDLQIEDLVVGEGAEAVPGATVSVHYTGTLLNGTKFDSSLDRGTPFQFVLGTGQVIQGWDQGVAGMKVGGKRKLTIPSKLGYGARGVPGAIPPNSTLVFEVELLEVQE
tara:strand:- start:6099 stop:6569 length:471 start_codon:yes stop_codon:yes gene_type:complete